MRFFVRQIHDGYRIIFAGNSRLLNILHTTLTNHFSSRFHPLFYLLCSCMSLIFVGFSFGGLLAESVTALLWKQPLLNLDFLQENVACISIGAPMIKLSTVAEVIEEMPQFGNTVHSILLDSDPIPRFMRFIDPRCEEVCTEILLSTGQPNALESLQVSLA